MESWKVQQVRTLVDLVPGPGVDSQYSHDGSQLPTTTVLGTQYLLLVTVGTTYMQCTDIHVGKCEKTRRMEASHGGLHPSSQNSEGCSSEAAQHAEGPGFDTQHQKTHISFIIINFFGPLKSFCFWQGNINHHDIDLVSPVLQCRPSWSQTQEIHFAS